MRQRAYILGTLIVPTFFRPWLFLNTSLLLIWEILIVATLLFICLKKSSSCGLVDFGLIWTAYTPEHSK